MSAYSDKVLADGAVAYWRLNETSGTTAVDLKGGNNGTISGGVTLNQPGALVDGDKAMTFDGNTGKITGGTFTISAAFSVEAWMKTTLTTPASRVSCWSNLASTDTVYCGIDSGKPYMYRFGGTNFFGVATVANGAWRHLVYTHDGTTARMYVDGVLDSTFVESHAAASGPLGIGFDQLSVSYWSGGLDDVAIYPTALTAAQIKAHYDATLTAGSPFLWFDEDEDPMPKYNIWTPITPSDTVDLPTLTDGVWVGTGGNVAAVMQNNQMPVVLAVPSGAWIPLAARRINATNTTATGIVALYER